MINQSVRVLFKLLRNALGNAADLSLPSDVDWPNLINLAFSQGVAAIAADGLQNIYDADPELELPIDAPEMENLKYDWFADGMACEDYYKAYRKAVNNLGSFYSSHGIKMMVLKGIGLSLNYPIPAHRPTGDIDIYLFGAWKEADDLVRRELRIPVDCSHEHHTVFQFRNYTVENHYDFINTQETRSARLIEQELKRLAGDGLYPTATFNAVFLMRHMGQHFAGEKITVRHLLDWGLFVDKHSDEIDWDSVIPYWKEIGISKFAQCINAICVNQLGLEASKFKGQISADSVLTDRILSNIISPEFDEPEPSGPLAKVVWFKFRRFLANGWKRKIVYKEGLLDEFVTGSIAKLKRHLQ